MIGLPWFESTNKMLGVTGVWAGDFKVGTWSLGISTSITQVLVVTRWPLPWNRYIVHSDHLSPLGGFCPLE